jgi:hypothetical protein
VTTVLAALCLASGHGPNGRRCGCFSMRPCPGCARSFRRPWTHGFACGLRRDVADRNQTLAFALLGVADRIRPPRADGERACAEIRGITGTIAQTNHRSSA